MSPKSYRIELDSVSAQVQSGAGSAFPIGGALYIIALLLFGILERLDRLNDALYQTGRPKGWEE